MLSWALAFFIIALVAAFFGFSGLAAGAASIGKVLFVGFLILAAISLVAGLIGGRRGTRHLP
jgi:uncharacterized membrane protein YtjA (UPF0391 family)